MYRRQIRYKAARNTGATNRAIVFITDAETTHRAELEIKYRARALIGTG